MSAPDSARSTGYSRTPLPKKLGLKPGACARVVASPMDYASLLGEVPPGVTFDGEIELDYAHLFVTSRRDLETELPGLMGRIKPNGMIWVSWPKKSSGMATDVTENEIREVALPMGLVDVKVCAVTHQWSGLRLVIRKKLRR